MLSISVLKCMSEYWRTMITLRGGARQKGQSQSSNPGLACKLLNYSCLSWIIHVWAHPLQHPCTTCRITEQASCGENKFVTQIYNIHHKQESMDSSFDKGQTDICLKCSWPTAHRSIFSAFRGPRRTAQECRQHPAHKQKICTENLHWKIKGFRMSPKA